MQGSTVKRIRKRLGLSRAALALQLDVSYVTVYRWEHDLHPIEGPARALLLRLEADRAKKHLDLRSITA